MTTLDDHMTASGANALAARIRAYWADRGYDVNTTVDKIVRGGAHTETLHIVRSDMVNGWPVKASKRDAA